MTRDTSPGLCGTCRWRREVASHRGARFLLCSRSTFDQAYPRYPRLPMLGCRGYVAAKETAVITVRRATEADVPLVLAGIRALADYERLSDRVVATEVALRETLFGPRPYAEVLLGELEGQPVGFALFFHNYSTFLARPGLYLEDLFVDASARGRGVGRALLGAVAKIAVERGCGRVEWAVLDWNAPAIGFYRRLGAEPLDDWTVFRLTGPALEAVAATST